MTEFTSTRRAPLSCLAGLLFLLALSSECGAQNEANDVIVYTSLRPPNQDIYLTATPGATPRRLTDHRGLDFNATFSPNGRWLVFTSERKGNVDLYAIDLENEKEPVRLTRSPAFDDAADISPDGEHIAFVSTRDGNADIFVMPFSPEDPNPEATNLTDHPLSEFRPAFSPDGSTIAYSRQNGRKSLPARFTSAIYLMDTDGSDARRLVGSMRFSAGSPAWSKDGQTVYYHRVPGKRLAPPGPKWRTEIWSVGASGSNARPVVTLDSQLVLSPSVGPDDRVAFYLGPPRAPGRPPARNTGWTYSTRPDGSERRLEVDSTGMAACLTPAFGPDGSIACHGPGPTSGLPVMANGRPFRMPGTRQTAKLPNQTVDLAALRGRFPDFLPEGRLAYGGFHGIISSRLGGEERRVVLDEDTLGAPWGMSTCRKNGTVAFSIGPTFAPVDAPVDIWKIQADGTGLTQLTADSTVNDAFPTWSSDCETIVFRSGRDGNKEIYQMDADGSNLRRLTHHEAVDTAPDISPDGERIVYSTTRGGPGYQLRIQRLNGSEGRFLEPERVKSPGRDMHPRFSPDGEWIVFISARSGLADEWLLSNGEQPYGELWAVPTEGGEAVRLTNDKWEDGLARWGTR